MRVITAQDIDDVLTFPSLIDALRLAFASGATSPERHHHALGTAPGGPVHLLMPAWSPDVPAPGSFLGTKIVNVFPANAAHSMPAVLGCYVLQAGDTGAPLATLDGTRLTLWRTAAASALAAHFLARSDARHLLMVGTGALAPFLIRAHAAVRRLERITVFGRRRAAAEAIAASLPDFPVVVGDDLRSAAAGADIISCATLATSPLLHGAWLRPGTHVDLVGAFTMGMREADDELLARAALFVDTPAALSEGGDVAIALANGVVTPAAVRATLSELCRGAHRGRTDGLAVTVFKSVGAAMEDLVAARLVWAAINRA